jgi:Nuclease-related domain
VEQLPPRFKKARSGPDEEKGMISPAETRDAFRQSAIRFLASIAALSVAGLALVISHPAWWPLSLVTVGSTPFLYRLAGLSRFRSVDPVVASGPMKRLPQAGYSVWHDVRVGDRVIAHVVVGPAGVFAISTVTWPGRFEVCEDVALRHSRKETGRLLWEASLDAAAVKGRLRAVGLRRVPVRAVMAATRAGVSGEPLDLEQAVVMRVSQVEAYVLSCPSSLAPAQIDRAVAAFEGEQPKERTRPGRG